MGAVGIQPRGENGSPRGINHVMVLKAAKVMARHCLPGEIVMVEKTSGKIMPADDGLTDDLAAKLIELGYVKAHQIRPGDRAISVRPIPPHLHGGEEPKVEQAVNPAPAKSERAVGKPQRGAV